MFEDLDDLCDTINTREGRTPVKVGDDRDSKASTSQATAAPPPKPTPPVKEDSRPEPQPLQEPPLEPQPLQEVQEAEAGTLARFKPSLTLEQALRLQEEMHDRFSRPEFQRRLRELEEVYGKAYEGRGGEAERAELFLTVHKELLPKNGFEGTQAGVVDMLQAASLHNGNPEYSEKREKLNQLLGLLPTPEDLALGRDAAGSGKGKGKGMLRGKGKGKGTLHSMGEILSLITRTLPFGPSFRGRDDASTTAGTETTAEDPEGM